MKVSLSGALLIIMMVLREVAIHAAKWCRCLHLIPLSSTLHHKYAVIDAEYADSDPVVITGSHNWTYSANNINDETTLFIHDMNLAKLYAAEFNSRYCELAPWDCNLIATHEQEQLEMKMFPSLAAKLCSYRIGQNTKWSNLNNCIQ